ncbi:MULTISPECIES: hypothetical protein [unclassified Streptomyces]|nr:MULTISPECIES: hypothetical protein [unclassified Streptomyces]WSA96502.1 hypothetical protein OIE63_36785 [Streptomyces sp. NBC_01795]WSB80916.1 hypothetical protein OHB04_37905 [Streptomyces sp. NBC_01775]WSS10873.1 hypothetical protein OG533_02350 [Streptomyces sp. NBC_01186]WSS39571.1 hypothetical protein OG220_02390 [Streptomyces sp. NBC_01187]
MHAYPCGALRKEIAEAVHKGTRTDPETVFDEGLGHLLDGIAARLTH